MFSIYLDNRELWTPGGEIKKLLSPTVDLAVNKVGSASFRITPDHPQYGAFVKMKSIITVIQDGRTIFKGRVFSDGSDFQTVKKIQAEGVLGYLNDSRVPPYEFTGTPAEYLAMLLDAHNAEVEDHQKFKLGVVTVTDPNDYIVRASSDWPKTWKEIETKLIDKLGGYICIRYENDGNYIDYLENYTDVSTQRIAFSLNLLDIDRNGTAANLATCIIPFGAKDEETGDRLDITTVNDGVGFVFDPDAVAQYGRIYEVVTWDDVTVPANLLRKARLYLAERVLLTDSLTIKVVDLHLADPAVESFKLGDIVEVYSVPHQIDERALITAYTLDLADPANSVLSIGVEKKSYLGEVSKESAVRTEEIKKQIGENTDTIVDRVLSRTENYITSEIQNAQETTREMLKDVVTTTELSQYKEQVSTRFSQTANDFFLSIQNVNTRITNENGELSQLIAEYAKYFNFTSEGLIIGAGDHAVKLVLDNDVIKFVKDGMVFGYWDGTNFHTGNLYIDVNERAQFGDFAFVPRSDGSLMFLKVGGVIDNTEHKPSAPNLFDVTAFSDKSDTVDSVSYVGTTGANVTTAANSVAYISYALDSDKRYKITFTSENCYFVGYNSDYQMQFIAKKDGEREFIFEGCVVMTFATMGGNFSFSDVYLIETTEAVNVTSYTVSQVANASYGFELNASMMYESQNKGKGNSAALSRILFDAPTETNINIHVINYAQTGYDYGSLSKVDTALGTTYTTDDSSKLQWIGNTAQTNTANVQTIAYTIPAGEHYIYAKYQKNNYTNQNNDSLQFFVEVVQ